MKIFFKSLYETLIYRLFWLAYPVSLYFLYDNGQMISFYLTLIIVLLSVIYFFSYYVTQYENNRSSYCAGLTKQFTLFIIGYLVQVNFIFMDTYEIIDGELEINYLLSALKILMIIETLKRIYYYAVGIIILLYMELGEKGDRSLYVMTFEIVYFYLWYNFYNNVHSTGFTLPYYYGLIGIIVCIINGTLAVFSYFLAAKICIGVLNLGFIIAHIYSIYWRHRESY